MTIVTRRSVAISISRRIVRHLLPCIFVGRISRQFPGFGLIDDCDLRILFEADLAHDDNLLITNNVLGGRGFRGSVGYTAAGDFRDVLGSEESATHSRVRRTRR